MYVEYLYIISSSISIEIILDDLISFNLAESRI